jgi:hypothetical protein
MLWDLLRNNDLKKSGCLHVVMQKFNKHQNRIEFPLSAKEMERAWTASSFKDKEKGMVWVCEADLEKVQLDRALTPFTLTSLGTCKEGSRKRIPL